MNLKIDIQGQINTPRATTQADWCNAFISCKLFDNDNLKIQSLSQFCTNVQQFHMYKT